MSMQTLPLAEIARRLELPMSTVTRWIRQGRIPIHRTGENGSFELRELKVWAREHKLEYSERQTDPSADPAASEVEISLQSCLERGGIHYDLQGSDVATVLAAAARTTPLPESAHTILAELMLQREELASTGIGRGVAIPHPRSPMSSCVSEATLSLCFLTEGVDFGAMDGEAVRVLFVVLSPSVKIHLRLLARLAYLLRHDAFVKLLHTTPDPETVLAAVADLQHVPHSETG